MKSIKLNNCCAICEHMCFAYDGNTCELNHAVVMVNTICSEFKLTPYEFAVDLTTQKEEEAS
jgi:hypothetical protein